MSVLLGVRGTSTQNSEEKSFGEGITQQSGSQYSGNPSASIWGDPLTSSFWHENIISPPSTAVTTASPSFSPVSVASEACGTMKNGDQKEQDQFSTTSYTSYDLPRRKGKESISGQESSEFGTSKDSFKQFGATTSNGNLQFKDYPSRSGMAYSKTVTKDGKPGIQADPFYTRLDYQPLFTGTSTIYSEAKAEILEKSDSESTSCRIDYETLNLIKKNSNKGHESLSEHKEVPEVFVFGASVPSADNARHVFPQHRIFESSFVPSSPRTRNKYKRQVRANKPGFGSNDTQQSVYFSREEAFSVESSHVDNAKNHTDAFTGLEGNQGRNPEVLHPSEPAVSIGIDNSLHQNQKNINQQDFLSQSDKNQPVRQMENIKGHFSLLFPSTKKSNEEPRRTINHAGESAWSFLEKEVSFNKTKDVEEDVVTSTSAVAGSGDSQSIPDDGEKPALLEKDNVHEFLHRIDNTGGNLETVAGKSSYIDDLSNKESNENDTNVCREMEDEKEKYGFLWNSGGNFLPKPYVFGSLHTSKMQVKSQSENLPSLKKNNLQETERNLKGRMQESEKQMFHQYVASNQADRQDDTTWSVSSSSTQGVKNVGRSTEGSAQLYSSTIFMNVESSYPNPNLSSTAQGTPIQNEFPRGEFSGPVSSSESSETECSPSRTEENSAGDGILHPKQYFEFQGNPKNIIAGPTMGKKKVWSSLKSRRQHKGFNKQRIIPKNGETYSSVTKDASSSMDFSPLMESANPEDKIVNLEELIVNSNNLTEQWADLKMEDKDDLMQFMENQSMEDLRTATANLSIQKDQRSTKAQSSNQESAVFEESREWMTTNLASKRSGSWKRTDFEEGQSVSCLENPLDASLSERENKFTTNQCGESCLSSFEPNQEMLSFTVGARSHMSRVGDTILPLTGRVGGSFDKRSSRPSRRSFSKINQSSIQKKNTEPPPSLSASTSFIDAGALESKKAGKSDAAEKACEAWRLRGNLAYENGDYPKAEEYYSRGASSVSPSETSQSCIRASMLCYSNRAATRMAVGRMREALDDCKRAMVIDSSFVRVRLRAALCHLALGESKSATGFFKECIKYAKNSSEPNSKVLADAIEGAKRAQQLDDYSERALQLLSKENTTDSTAALRLVNEALSISPFSETLHELKTSALLSLKRYEEAVQWCEQSLPAAEKSHGITVNEQHQDNFSNRVTQNSDNFHLKRWRWRLSAKCLYYLGKLEEAVDLLEKHEASLSANTVDKNVDSLETFMNSIRELARHKAAGNKAFQLGKHAEAVEHYTAALACNGESRPYNAVCFCNRAAASQALGHITDAIADCSRAIALDSSYPKALSRRATLHEMIRDYGQACNDLRRLITVLEDNRSDERGFQPSKGGTPSVNVHDLKQAQGRLAKVEEEMKKGAPVDHYLLLGVGSTSSSNEIKKAYRKAALKHHPDKASQFLKRENGDVGSLWKEVGVDEVRADAERLFKLIGEANAILSDPVKKSRYDSEEARRQMRATSSGFAPRTVSDLFRHHYESSGLSSYYRWENRTDNTNPTFTQHQRWQSAPDAAQPDIYAQSRSNSGRNSTSEFSWDTS